LIQAQEVALVSALDLTTIRKTLNGLTGFATKQTLNFDYYVGSISPTYYEQLLRAQIPKAQKNTVKLSVLFSHLGPARVKAARKMLLKFFLSKIPKAQRDTDELTVLFSNLRSVLVKVARKMLVKSTRDLS